MIFDMQAALASRGDGSKRDEALSTVAAYYRHATSARMSYLIAVIMMATLASIILQLIGDSAPNWVPWLSLIGAGGPIVLALTNTVPCAVKLGKAPADERAVLARRVLRDHLIAIAGLTLALVLQLTCARS